MKCERGSCDNECKQLHKCPFDEEIHNGKKMCGCCDACMRECADDI